MQATLLNLHWFSSVLAGQTSTNGKYPNIQRVLYIPEKAQDFWSINSEEEVSNHFLKLNLSIETCCPKNPLAIVNLGGYVSIFFKKKSTSYLGKCAPKFDGLKHIFLNGLKLNHHRTWIKTIQGNGRLGCQDAPSCDFFFGSNVCNYARLCMHGLP